MRRKRSAIGTMLACATALASAACGDLIKLDEYSPEQRSISIFNGALPADGDAGDAEAHESAAPSDAGTTTQPDTPAPTPTCSTPSAKTGQLKVENGATSSLNLFRVGSAQEYCVETYEDLLLSGETNSVKAPRGTIFRVRSTTGTLLREILLAESSPDPLVVTLP